MVFPQDSYTNNNFDGKAGVHILSSSFPHTYYLTTHSHPALQLTILSSRPGKAAGGSTLYTKLLWS